MAEIISGNVQNEADAKAIRSRSRFNLSYHNFQTMRFGELTPFYVEEVLGGDKSHRLNSKHDVRAYTLGAPLMSNIDIKKDYFIVPKMAVLPRTWDLIHTNPTIGDDVPDDAYSVLKYSNIVSSVNSYLNSLRDIIYDTTKTDNARFTSLFKWMMFAELWFSDGSLISQMGYKFATCYHGVAYEGASQIDTNISSNFDAVFDWLCGKLVAVSGAINVRIDNIIEWSGNFSDLRSLLEFLRDNPVFEIEVNGTFPNISLGSSSQIGGFTDVTDDSDYFVDFLPVAAYQIICAHYYTNDQVDYIYSATLWRELMWSFFYSTISVNGDSDIRNELMSFSYNGQYIQYDSISGCVLSYLISLLDFSSSLAYWHHLLSFKHSLRFMDYFAGAKKEPLAVGDVNVAVNNGYVNLLDQVQKRWLMKYLNFSQKVGRKIEEYSAKLSGTYVKPDFHNPFWLGHTSDTVYGQEVENTGEAQMSSDVPVPITSNLRSNASRYAFEIDSVDRDSIVIGIAYFDVPRSYYSGVWRMLQHNDRFNMFNPFMQFLGDQVVKNNEIFSRYTGTFGYQGRYAEYKQRYNIASGGFVNALPGWTFLNDMDEKKTGSITNFHLSPSFVRSRSIELDRFFKSLSGWSLATYFHFIVDTYNEVSISRPMAFNPSID